MNNYSDKFNNTIKNTIFYKLPTYEQEFIKDKSHIYNYSHSQILQLISIARDIQMWDEGRVFDIFTDHPKLSFKKLIQSYEELRVKKNSYKNFEAYVPPDEQKFNFKTKEDSSFGLGACPVASEKTRCCNLLTLDAIESCGFDCSYCSIQSFYNQNTITFDASFAKKLSSLELDKNQMYHIGTGQSSDSLLFGNKEGVLDALFDFAKSHENVILEFKTKSNNISYLLENPLVKNILPTWSLNTNTIVQNEEHLSASLEKRLKAAREVANKGYKVGFHFHPIVEYENYLAEYKELYDKVLDMFSSSEVALVSFGTLTFIKPVIKVLRNRGLKSKITQMPFEDASGKSSYPKETKVEMFKHAYESFKPWHKEVFFYLCMEEHELWNETFGYNYSTNNDFERAMVSSYANKLGIKMIY
ncbi:MAG: spore photoproduct lyase family protein [Sulfurimonas sp.]|jgi:spore photoproduct lyase|nr:hypothetical protein [Sulfurimonadaceae bacterium]